jgi:hypothetical protein
MELIENAIGQKKILKDLLTMQVNSVIPQVMSK